jgi:hypothetical protein
MIRARINETLDIFEPLSYFEKCLVRFLRRSLKRTTHEMCMSARNNLGVNLRLDLSFPGLVRKGACSSDTTSIRELCYAMRPPRRFMTYGPPNLLPSRSTLHTECNLLPWRHLITPRRSTKRLHRLTTTSKPSHHERIETSYFVEEETVSGYNPNPYYPVKLGETLHGRYKIIGKLGFGSASTVWLCRDLQK